MDVNATMRKTFPTSSHLSNEFSPSKSIVHGQSPKQNILSLLVGPQCGKCDSHTHTDANAKLNTVFFRIDGQDAYQLEMRQSLQLNNCY